MVLGEPTRKRRLSIWLALQKPQKSALKEKHTPLCRNRSAPDVPLLPLFGYSFFALISHPLIIEGDNRRVPQKCTGLALASCLSGLYAFWEDYLLGIPKVSP